MKYVLYKSNGKLNKEIKKHELIGVEFGEDIYSVENQLKKDIKDDLIESGYIESAEDIFIGGAVPSAVYGPAKRYRYGMEATFTVGLDKSRTVEFGIKEVEEA